MAPLCDAALTIERPPSEKLPLGAIDCHFHIFGPTVDFPYAPDRSYTPPDAPLAAYEKMADTFGIGRAVIIQPSVYGFDNSRTLSAMKQSRLPMRAIAVVDPEISEREVEELHVAGVRGVRVNLLFAAGLALDSAERLADKIRPFGWHIQFLADVSQLNALPSLIDHLDIPVVFDHFGHIKTPKPHQTEGFHALLALVRESRVWVKLSGAYRTTHHLRPPYDDLRPTAEALLRANPRQLVWGTDWPHPSIPVPMPDDTDLLETMLSWVSDHAIREQIFISNPARLYGFEEGNNV